MDGSDELIEELRALRAEVAELRARIEAPATTTDASTERRTFDPPSSRREIIGRVVMTAGAAAAAGVALVPSRVAATSVTDALVDGDALAVGKINVCSSTTELKLPTTTPQPVFSHVLVVQDGVWSTPRAPFADEAPETGTSAGVAGLVGAAVLHGGYFQTNHPSAGAAGVRARGESSRSYGVWAAGRRAALRLERLPLQIPPSDRSDSHNEGEFLIDDNSDLWYCVVPGSPGRWLKLSGPSTAGQFHAITPARVYDSRYTAAVDSGVGRLEPSTSRTISVANAFQVNSSTQSIANVVPRGSTAIAYNLTVVDTGPAGYLSVNPGGTPTITAASINWSSAGMVLGNAAIVALDGSRQLRIFCAGSSTDFVIDVTGYFR